MAEMKGTTLGILVRIGAGAPVEVAEVEVPIHLTFERQTRVRLDDRAEVSAFIGVDLDKLNSDIRSALIAAAEELPGFRPV